MRSWTRAIALVCSASSVLTYERENAVCTLSLRLYAEAGEPARVGRGGERRVSERHDDPHSVTALVLERREVRRGTNLQ